MEPTIQPTVIDWAKLAVIFDCEGNIYINRPNKGRYYQLQITVGSTDFALLEWCLARFGGAIYKNTTGDLGKGPNYEPARRWRIENQKASDALERCLGEFIIKRQQAELAIAFWNVYRKKGQRLSESERLRCEELRLELRALTRRGPKPQVEESPKSSPQAGLFH